jgi:hypothetical protein
VVGDNGILETIDSGTNWVNKSVPALTATLLGISCANATTCQAVGTATNLGGLILTLPAAPTITTTSLPIGTVGQLYSQTLNVTGGRAPYTWSVLSGSLPQGLSLASASGNITGIPPFPGSQVVTFEVTDANELSSQVSLTITINPHAAPGYWLVASDGGIFSFGGAHFYGSTGSLSLNAPIVGMAATPDDNGYWLVASDGGIFSFGDAVFYGSTARLHLNAPIVGLARTPDGRGYWLVASDGGIFAFGDAGYYGSTGSLVLNRPIVGMAATANGKGYWLVASDGGVFSFGDAQFSGSTGGLPLNKPIVGMAADPAGGYWLVASDGGIFTFVSNGYFGSAANVPLQRPVIGMASTADGNGYWMVATDGGIFAFGDAHFYGSTGSLKLNKPVVGMAAIDSFS